MSAGVGTGAAAKRDWSLLTREIVAAGSTLPYGADSDDLDEVARCGGVRVVPERHNWMAQLMELFLQFDAAESKPEPALLSAFGSLPRELRILIAEYCTPPAAAYFEWFARSMNGVTGGIPECELRICVSTLQPPFRLRDSTISAAATAPATAIAASAALPPVSVHRYGTRWNDYSAHATREVGESDACARVAYVTAFTSWVCPFESTARRHAYGARGTDPRAIHYWDAMRVWRLFANDYGLTLPRAADAGAAAANGPPTSASSIAAWQISDYQFYFRIFVAPTPTAGFARSEHDTLRLIVPSERVGIDIEIQHDRRQWFNLSNN